MKALSLNIKQWQIALAIVLSVSSVLLNPLLWLTVPLLLFFLIMGIRSEKDLIMFFIFSLLVITSDVNDLLRAVINSAAIIFFIYYFLKHKGTEINSYPHLPRSILWFILIVICSMLLSSIFSANIIVGIISTGRQILFFLICYILFSTINEEKDIFRYAGILIASGSAAAFVIIWSLLSSGKGIMTLLMEGMLHEGGAFGNVTAAGGIFAVTIPLTLVFAAGIKKLNFRYAVFFLMIVQAAGLFLTNSRAAVLSVIVSFFIVFFILKRRTFLKFTLLTILSLIVLFIVLPSFSDIVNAYFRTGRILENTRFTLWDMSARIISDNLIWGTGPGLFKSQMYTHMPVMLGTWDAAQVDWIYDASGMGESHNFILFRTAELGILGLLSALVLPVLFFYYSVKVLRKKNIDRRIYLLAVGIFSIGAGLIVRSMFEATGLLSHGWVTRDLPFWLCFGIVIYIYKNRNKLA